MRLFDELIRAHFICINIYLLVIAVFFRSHRRSHKIEKENVSNSLLYLMWYFPSVGVILPGTSSNSPILLINVLKNTKYYEDNWYLNIGQSMHIAMWWYNYNNLVYISKDKTIIFQLFFIIMPMNIIPLIWRTRQGISLKKKIYYI